MPGTIVNHPFSLPEAVISTTTPTPFYLGPGLNVGIELCTLIPKKRNPEPFHSQDPLLSFFIFTLPTSLTITPVSCGCGTVIRTFVLLRMGFPLPALSSSLSTSPLRFPPPYNKLFLLQTKEARGEGIFLSSQTLAA